MNDTEKVNHPDRKRAEELSQKIAAKQQRKLKARHRRDRPLWFGLGMFGLVGWSVAIPTLIGIALGIWLDMKLPARFSWTLTLLFVGVILGCLNAWYWIKRESRNHGSGN
ncbi:MAG: AtpZ/AtpI family protein [Deltaproteobacteria bacterium]|nr:AtpZ/AtpI family protein [Deltaproteobacteria bacterium]MBW1951869.1 AtpZ/AtpI family protein [Deltaproteobacteria bacterium]MBW1986552.1 AtpZ/AtpI family protein [Deltaproteobacteria bacterium]MBW2134505.1 AtpZ/AtpI family protein [Deltaproteobacteria bacterium]